MTDFKKPKVTSSLAERELDSVEEQFKKYDENIQSLTVDRMNEAPKLEVEQQTKLSQSEISKSKEIYLKPHRSIGSREKFNEDYRKEYEYAKEYVHFIAENKEIIGEDIDLWSKPFAGMPAERWKVPVNKPVWGPRYLAEQIKKCRYHRLSMQQNSITSSDGMGTYHGTIIADNIIQRLDAMPVSSRKSVFMGANF